MENFIDFDVAWDADEISSKTIPAPPEEDTCKLCGNFRSQCELNDPLPLELAVRNFLEEKNE